VSLAEFLNALKAIDATDGPAPGTHNFYRGGALATYDSETREALEKLRGRIDTDLAQDVWERALATQWEHDPVWFHGDIAVGNLLLRDGRLSAVIDFGTFGVGDPACDLAITWTLFTGESREAFRSAMPYDGGTWARGRAWTLWKALIVAAGQADTNAAEATHSMAIINEVLNDFQ
jgi:aminoglycoside phosphotransferase (APT) family kinase protein